MWHVSLQVNLHYFKQNFKQKLVKIYSVFNFKNFVASFYWWVSTASVLEQLRGGSLLFTTNVYHVTFYQNVLPCRNYINWFSLQINWLFYMIPVWRVFWIDIKYMNIMFSRNHFKQNQVKNTTAALEHLDRVLCDSC